MRGDLSPGLQCSQSVHAAHAYAIEHPESFAKWHRESNTIVIVAAPTAERLLDIETRARTSEIPYSTFADDDLGAGTTSLALGPGGRTRKLCWGLPLALKEVLAGD